MTTNPIHWLVLVSLLLPLRAEEPALHDLLRDALYTEEVTRDTEKAARQYEALLARHDAQKTFAASALFRLAEVRRKQDRKDDAIQLYQRLLTEFPNADAETKLARENLAALGGKPLETKGPAADAESLEIARLEGLAKSAPDIILDPKTLEQAADKGWPRVVAHLLTAGSRPYAGDALRIAAEKGYLEIVRHLTASETPVPADVATAGIQAAIKFNRYTILEFLLQRGFKPGEMTGKYEGYYGSNALCYALLTGSPKCAEILLKHDADLDATSGGGRSMGEVGRNRPPARHCRRKIRRGDTGCWTRARNPTSRAVASASHRSTRPCCTHHQARSLSCNGCWKRVPIPTAALRIARF